MNSTVVLEALDLSQLTGVLFIFPGLTTAFSMGSVLVKDCKLNAAMTVTPPPNTGLTFQLVRSAA
jgi:hypothetical protein